MRAFVTGATGLLGNNLVRLLLERGHQVTALVRSREKAQRLFGDYDLRLVVGDMSDSAAFGPALEGCDVVFHTAAYFREYFQPGDHWPTLEAINVRGTMALLAESERRGVGRVIYTSSSGVIGMRPGQGWGDESDGPDALVMENLYFRSKVVAEQEIAGFLARSSLPVVLILPGWMFGPGDTAPTSSGQIVLDFLNRKLPGTISGGGAPVDVRDVAAAMLAAVERGRSGERYIVGGDRYVSFAELFQLLSQVSGIPAPRLPIPLPAMLAYATLSEAYGRLTGKPVLATRQGVRTLQHVRTTHSDKARRELGISFRPLAETLRDEVAWFRAQRLAAQGLGARGQEAGVR